MNPGEFSVDCSGDGAVITFGEGFDMLSSAPGGGFRENIPSISIGAGADGGFCITPGEPGLKVSVQTGRVGRTSVAVIAVSDLRSGIGRAGERCPGTGGTHLVVVMDCDMPVSAMARATMTAEEAVTVVIQDLVLACDATDSLGSGSSVLSVTAVRNTVSDLYLHGAGKHSKLGELIGVCSRDAVRESAEMNGMTPELAGSVQRRLSRLCKSKNVVYSAERCPDASRLSFVSAILFVRDEMQWGLIPKDVAENVIVDLISVMREDLDVDYFDYISSILSISE